MLPITPSQAILTCITTLILYLLNLWVIGIAVNYVYMTFRQLYQFDYRIQSLLMYLEQAGLSTSLVESVRVYTSQLWKRQSGTCLVFIS